jgi:hypothetical protein
VAEEKGETSHRDNKKRKATFAGDESAKRLFKIAARDIQLTPIVPTLNLWSYCIPI